MNIDQSSDVNWQKMQQIESSFPGTCSKKLNTAICSLPLPPQQQHTAAYQEALHNRGGGYGGASWWLWLELQLFPIQQAPHLTFNKQ